MKAIFCYNFGAMLSFLLAVALTNAAEIATLLKCDRPEADSFDFKANVSCIVRSSPNDAVMTFTDPSGSVAVRALRDILDNNVHDGDLVRAQGHLKRTDPFSVEAWLDKADVLRREVLPTPPVRTIAELYSGRFDWQPARLCGEIRDAFASETSANWAIMILVADKNHISVSTPLNGTPIETFQRLIGRKVTVDGFVNPDDGSIRFYIGRVFHCPSIDAIRPIGIPPDPFDSPPIEALKFLRPSEIAAHGRIRTSGKVISAWGDGQVLLRRENGRIVQAVCLGQSLPSRGSSIEIVGFPSSDLFHITLSHAKWRPATHDFDIREPDAKTLSARDILIEDVNRLTTKIWLLGRTIRIHARVRNLPDRDIRKDTLLVEDEAFVISVDVSAAPDAMNDVREGCTVNITGTCVFETENWRDNLVYPQIRGFRIIVNEPTGIVITTEPPWWTPGRLLTAIGILCAALLGVFIWNRALNRLAERRGRNLLREEIGHVKADLKTEERTRLAVELHDSLAQNLTGVSMEIETAQRCGTDNVPELMRHLGIADKALKSCRSDLRNTLWDLRNFSLEERDMDKAIRRTLLPHVRDVNLAVRFNVSRHRLSDRIAHEILRIIRELVLNGIRHGKATEIRIAGGIDGENLLFSVRDNGCGFDPEDCPGVTEGHFGLQGIRERLRGIAGGIAFDNAPGRGTKAVVKIRMQKPDTGEKP